MNDLLAVRSGQPENMIREATREGMSLSASAAIFYGFADELALAPLLAELYSDPANR